MLHCFGKGLMTLNAKLGLGLGRGLGQGLGQWSKWSHCSENTLSMSVPYAPQLWERLNDPQC